MSKIDSFEREFSSLRDLGEKVFTLRGSTIIVEILPPEEIKTKGGLIMASDSDQRGSGTVDAHKMEVGKVLMTGEGYWDEATNALVPLGVSPGAIVILPQYSTQKMSHFPGIQRPTGNTLAMVKMDQVLAYYPSQEAYELAKSKLNG